VVCFTGDGSLLMNLQELATAAEEDANVKVILLNNGTLGLVRQQQQLFYGGRYHASQFQTEPDFAAIARGFRITAYDLGGAADPVATLARALREPGPCLVGLISDGLDNLDPLADLTEGMEGLARDFHVAAFDMRGVGASSPPRDATGYRLDVIARDHDAVADAVFGPGATAHVVGHDWGSVIGFAYVMSDEGRRRVRSFSSISGPHPAMAQAALRRQLRAHTWRERAAAVRQVAASGYIFAFQIPGFERALGTEWGAKALSDGLRRGGVRADDPYLRVSADEARSRTAHAIALYRQNAFRRADTAAPREITTPVQLIVPDRDPFVRPQMLAAIGDVATNLRTEPIDASHWAIRSHAALVADLVRAHARRVDATAGASLDATGREQ
jgi:pimeloyl-ACP methyl ester carboxylesterase